jgi:WD40 repeat protein
LPWSVWGDDKALTLGLLAFEQYHPTVHVWDIATGKLRTLTAKTAFITCVSFSPDGQHLVVKAFDDLRGIRRKYLHFMIDRRHR